MEVHSQVGIDHGNQHGVLFFPNLALLAGNQTWQWKILHLYVDIEIIYIYNYIYIYIIRGLSHPMTSAIYIFPKGNIKLPGETVTSKNVLSV